MKITPLCLCHLPLEPGSQLLMACMAWQRWEKKAPQPPSSSSLPSHNCGCHCPSLIVDQGFPKHPHPRTLSPLRLCLYLSPLPPAPLLTNQAKARSLSLSLSLSHPVFSLASLLFSLSISSQIAAAATTDPIHTRFHCITHQSPKPSNHTGEERESGGDGEGVGERRKQMRERCCY